MKGFRDLIVWQKSHQLVLKVYEITKEFPSDEKFGLVSQLRRSSVSVSANLVEGYKKSKRDFNRFVDISQGSLEETKYYFLLSRDLGYLREKEYEGLICLSEEIGIMLNALGRKLKVLSKRR